MNKADLRRLNLERLSKEIGQAELARRVGRAPQQINDMLAGRKSFGEKIADKFTAALDLPQGWFDTPMPTYSQPKQATQHIARDTVFDNHATDQEQPEAVVIDWDEVADFETIVRTPGAREHVRKAHSTHGRGFVLRMREDSMLPTLPVGSMVLIDPDELATHDRLVLVAEPGVPPLLRRLVIQGSQRMLKADNERYGPLTPMSARQSIVGVAINAIVTLI